MGAGKHRGRSWVQLSRLKRGVWAWGHGGFLSSIPEAASRSLAAALRRQRQHRTAGRCMRHADFPGVKPLEAPPGSQRKTRAVEQRLEGLGQLALFFLQRWACKSNIPARTSSSMVSCHKRKGVSKTKFWQDQSEGCRSASGRASRIL